MLPELENTNAYLLILSCLGSLHGAPATSTDTREALKLSVLSKPKLRPHIVTNVLPRIGPEVGKI